MGTNNQVDNLYFFMDESFENVRREFGKRLKKTRNGFLHKQGSTTKLYENLGGIALDLLDLQQRIRCETSYNMMGVITTPMKMTYGRAIPVFNEIADYCEENHVSAGFLSIHGDKHIEHYDAELKIPINRTMIERRMRDPINYKGHEKRNESKILTKKKTFLH